MALNLQLRAAPNIADNDFSFEGLLQAFNITNPLGNCSIGNLGGLNGFINIFGPPSGFTYCMIIPDPNFTGMYKLQGPSTDTGAGQCAGVSMFPCIPTGNPAVPTFGMFLQGNTSAFIWTFLFL